MTDEKEKIWIFTFEYAGIAKVGGLGEVTANQAKNLSKYFDFTVFMPAHGKIEQLKNNMELKKISFTTSGEISSNIQNFETGTQFYEINYYLLKLNGVKIILLTGGNDFTKAYLDDLIVYNPDTFNYKLKLYSLGIKAYINHLIKEDPSQLPKIIHMHDYHAVIPFICCKQELSKRDLDVASAITIHLLTWPRFNIEFYKECGIEENIPITILMRNGIEKKTLQEIFTLCENNSIPTVEKIGAVISDLVLTVSETYLKSDIIPNLGGNLIDFKSNFVWNGCDWDYNEIKQKVLNKLGGEIRQFLNLSENDEITREHMKHYLLTYKISHLSQSPLINSKKILNAINEISNGNPFIKNGNIQPFKESGPLVITTGRISKQKGFDIIFNSIQDIIKEVPSVKFLMLLLPTEYTIDEIKEYAHYVKLYPNNIRIIFGLAADIFHLAHLAADVYCALSRWEPFGIIALEAMAVKIPIIATRVGGLQESIIDIRKDPENGTGILIKKDNLSEFINALITILKLNEISETVKIKGSLYADPQTLNIVNSIPDQVVKSRVLLDPHYIEKIRENGYNRVKHYFRWEIVSKKLKELYENLIINRVSS
ncbi:MAG: glycogen/starch synthase [Promethearchaeia archaeon]